MLISPQYANQFLKNYKALLTAILGFKPSSLDEWVEGRLALMNTLTEDPAYVQTLELDVEFKVGLSEAVYGDFCFLKRYKNYCALQHLESGVFFGVSSLTTPLEEMIPEYSIITTGVIPFSGVMVCDGLVQASNMILGKNYARSMRDGYWEAKRDGSLVLNVNAEK